jgi:hypothetical protein
LAWLNRTIPTQITRGIRIAAGDIRIPGTGKAIGGVLPADSPAINGCCAGVSNGDSGSRTGIPFIANAVSTTR